MYLQDTADKPSIQIVYRDVRGKDSLIRVKQSIEISDKI